MILKQLPQDICRSVVSIYHRYLSKPRHKCGRISACPEPNAKSERKPIAEVAVFAAVPLGAKWSITEEEQRKIDEVMKELDRVIQENDS